MASTDYTGRKVDLAAVTDAGTPDGRAVLDLLDGGEILAGRRLAAQGRQRHRLRPRRGRDGRRVGRRRRTGDRGTRRAERRGEN